MAPAATETAAEAPVATEASVATEAPVANEAPAAQTEGVAATEGPVATEVPADIVNAQPSVMPTLNTIVTVQPTVEPVIELRVLELEWPESIRYGSSDVVRLALVPSVDGYTASVEYEEHSLTSQDVSIKRPAGYTLSAVARLDGVGFEISPAGNQEIVVLPAEKVTWRWSIAPQLTGNQRVSIFLMLRWQPDAASSQQVRESVVFDRNLDIRVNSFFGLRSADTMTLGLAGLVFSSVLGLWSIAGKRSFKRKRLLVVEPNSRLSIEPNAGIVLNPNELGLLQALFKKYQRILLKNEFLSGYSGARSFLASPINANGQSDAETIIKIGPRKDIEDEYNHYESFVKDRLPPVTARIQSVPITLAGFDKAALQYTCISEPGKSPTSFRQALLANPDPEYLQRLFDTFGPNWWMQRQPYSFRLGQEYDRLLPPQLVLEPATGSAKKHLNPNSDPTSMQLSRGDVVNLSAFEQREIRPDRKSLTLCSASQAGKPVFRYRWQAINPPRNSTARIIATRSDLLVEATADFDLFGLPNPLQQLDGWLQETMNGTQSIIHGDLNLENILVGPGNLVWLIDFAQTREGHPQYDFSHLACEIIAHIISQREISPQQYLSMLQDDLDPLMKKVEEISGYCLFNPNNPREYRLGLILSCMGGLKYHNLNAKAKHLLFITAAYYGSSL
ncbi:MAG: hypothetical protein C0410_09985 [Anaerolinea sp.]|nr:hypothetical protein [Anaerolinea sp.]